ncbi:MAG TPA: MGMT family protein [Methylomirabilota bacterium]
MVSGRVSIIVLELTGTDDFARQVYEAAREIPSGQTRTYGEIAKALGQPREAQAVGQALGKPSRARRRRRSSWSSGQRGSDDPAETADRSRPSGSSARYLP